MHGHHACSGVHQGTSDRSDERLQAAEFADDDARVRQSLGPSEDAFALDDRGDTGCFTEMLRYPLQRESGLGTTDPVGGQTTVALEVHERSSRALVENAIDPPTPEPECAEQLLQLHDVFAALSRGVEIQEPFAESAAGLDDGGPCLWSADAVHVQRVGALKRLDGLTGVIPEEAVDVERFESELDEPALEISDVIALCSDAEGSD